MHALRFLPVSSADRLILFTAFSLLLTGPSAPAADQAASGDVTAAVAVLLPTAGSNVQGVVRFARATDGVRVTALISGLKPGQHGFHIHEFGDLTAKDGTAAGGHFNPAHMAHAGRDAAARHVGDLGNITADADGNATVNFVDPTIALEGPRSILGRSVVVHADPDDLTTQPTGNAGARVAVGVIGIAKG